MAWKWYAVESYKISVGAETGDYYGAVQLMSNGFYSLLKFHKQGPLPAPTAPAVAGVQRFYGHLDYQQMAQMVDILRNEKPLQFGWYGDDPRMFHLMTGEEPVGEGDGTLAAKANPRELR